MLSFAAYILKLALLVALFALNLGTILWFLSYHRNSEHLNSLANDILYGSFILAFMAIIAYR